MGWTCEVIGLAREVERGAFDGCFIIDIIEVLYILEFYIILKFGA